MTTASRHPDGDEAPVDLFDERDGALALAVARAVVDTDRHGHQGRGPADPSASARDSTCALIEPVAALAWRDNQQTVQIQIRQGLPHRSDQPGGIRPLDLHADAQTVLKHQQIEFGAAMGGPEPGAFGSPGRQQLLDFLPHLRQRETRHRHNFEAASQRFR
jgi:hypothetical protein